MRNVWQIVNKLQRNIEQKNKVWSDPLHELVDILLTRTSSIKLRKALPVSWNVGEIEDVLKALTTKYYSDLFPGAKLTRPSTVTHTRMDSARNDDDRC